MVSPSYAHKSCDARQKHHMDDDFDNKLRSIERKLDKFNHLMELARTCLAGCTLILQVVILLKLFGII